MATRYLRVFADLPIPIDYACTQTYALLAKRDGGKTYTTLKFEEQLCDAGLFFVTLDPVGKHWALRAGADGDAGGGKGDVWVLGGLHGDVPLEPDSGALIADTVVDHPGRYVLDVSTFDSDAEQDRFASAFGQRLFRRKARDPGFPLLVILEEAESFIPQTPQPGQQKMLGAYARIVRQGRNHGLGMLMVAQRGQALNKGVLSQAEVLIVKQMAHNRDIDQVKEWVKANGTPELLAEMLGSLAGLKQNEAYVWSPSWLEKFVRTTVQRRVTFDSSASVKGGQSAQRVELAPLDVDALGEKIAATAERAKGEDPRALRRRIKELEAQLADGVHDGPEILRLRDEVEHLMAERNLTQGELDDIAETVGLPKDGSYAVVRDRVAQLERLAQFIGPRLLDVNGLIAPLVKQAGSVQDAVDELRSDVSDFERDGIAPWSDPSGQEGVHTAAAPTRPATGAGQRARGSNGSRRAPSALSAGSGNAVDAGRARAQPASSPADGDGPSGAQLAVLTALAQLEAIGVPIADKRQAALFSGNSPSSSTWRNKLSSCKTAGWIDYPSPGTVALTDRGRALAPATLARPTQDELDTFIVRLVGPTHYRIIEELQALDGDAIAKDELAERVGASPSSSTWRNQLSRLRTLGLVDYPRAREVMATDIVFIGN